MGGYLVGRRRLSHERMSRERLETVLPEDVYWEASQMMGLGDTHSG